MWDEYEQSDDVQYRHCLIARDGWLQYTWLPEAIAKEGQMVRLKTPRDEDQSSWRIVIAFQATQSGRTLDALRRARKGIQ